MELASGPSHPVDVDELGRSKEETKGEALALKLAQGPSAPLGMQWDDARESNERTYARRGRKSGVHEDALAKQVCVHCWS